jgi:hypothetical protein
LARELRTKRPESSRTIIVPQSKRTAEVTTGNNVRNVHEKRICQ